MAEQVTYYGLLGLRDSRENPSGLARRRVMADGGVVEETFRRDLQWHKDSVIWEWRRGESSEELVEISEIEAERVMEEFRKLFG